MVLRRHLPRAGEAVADRADRNDHGRIDEVVAQGEQRAAEQGEVDEISPTLRGVRDNLDAVHLKWIEDLSMTAVVDETFFLCHGSPCSDTEYLLVEVSEHGVALRSSQALLNLTAGITQSVVLCGHDHIPRTVRLPNGKLVVNPGSVGLPAYQDDSPYPHAMETGTPHVRYSIVSGSEAGWQVEDVAVPYDWDTASRAAHENGRVDWAEWLRTGRANGGN